MTYGTPYPHHRLKLKTYSHLAKKRRIPSEYELVTSQLLYYTGRGFEVKTPIHDWYEKNQFLSPIQGVDWEMFKDPRETTYTRYTSLQKDKELVTEGVLHAIEATRSDSRLPDEWVQFQALTFGALRYLYHGLEMIGAYAGSMAPSGRIAISCLLQSADEMRKIQILSYRLSQLQLHAPQCVEASRLGWQNGSDWQPIRKFVEHALITYDWAESMTVLNVLLKPVCDEAFFRILPEIAIEHGDSHFGDLSLTIMDDSIWQRQWTQELFSLIAASSNTNRECIVNWIDKWQPLLQQAIESIADFLTPISRKSPSLIRNELHEFSDQLIARSI